MAVEPSSIRFDHEGLVPVIIQDALTNAVLMLGYANRDALEQTTETGLVHFWSRSRGELWQKGATSGNTLAVQSVNLDCDSDAILIRATPAGPTCHTGQTSCFKAEPTTHGIQRLWNTITERVRQPTSDSYTATLVAGGTDAVARKVIEESGELVLAAKNHENGGEPDRVIEESADLVYHLFVLLAERGLDLADVERELDQRAADG
ncbi:MAG: bifunctional phosphoribosyl-AMP cyclohydrolase/phosphoribosyl-ATP diphosphatase HisIE [Actinomycetia bacterium]|nr:bifunctional phosphoribosyl-AMP cyclohydrolase/phosphoribosyl-ATP diphosphatase HisIE [Actinomycetes bacterium]